MKFEHVAFNVKEPARVAAWYVEHLNMKLRKANESPPFMHFIADESESVMFELYNKPPDEVPDYANQNPLVLHLAFTCPDPETEKARLIKAGCTQQSDETLPDGSRLVMLRDPWGLALQLCQRATPLL